MAGQTPIDAHRESAADLRDNVQESGAHVFVAVCLGSPGLGMTAYGRDTILLVIGLTSLEAGQLWLMGGAGCIMHYYPQGNVGM